MIRALVVALLLLTAAAAEAACPPYHREDWPHWSKAANDCQDTRTKVLIRDSSEPVAFRDETQCEVAWGKWIDPYTGTTIQDPDKVHIDHVVALKEAHDAGGCHWSQAKKEAYANDLTYYRHLRAVSGSANMKKSAKPPNLWMPERKAAHCAYVEERSAIKAKWGLTISAAERAAIAKALETCQPTAAPAQSAYNGEPVIP